MEVSRLIIASTAHALANLQYERKQCTDFCEIIEIEAIMRWLRVARTFCYCTTTLANNVELRIEGNDDTAVARRMIKDLGCLLDRVKDIVSRILFHRKSSDPFGFQSDMESSEAEMDKWYTTLSSFLRQYSTSPRVYQIKVIIDFVLKDLVDYLSTENGYDYQFENQVSQIKSVINNITFLEHIICFGTLLCAENQYLLTQFEPLVISAAHFTLQLFSNVRGPIPLPNGLTNPMVHNSILYESCAPAMASLNQSLELYNPSIELKYYLLTAAVVKEFLVSLLWTLWEMLQSDKLQTVYRGLRFLRIILENQPEKFDDGRIRNTTLAAICNAGVVIFSHNREDFEISHANQEFSENIRVIRLEVIGYVLKTNFPETNILGFLDFLLEDYMAEVKGSKVDSDTLGFVPNIQEYLVFLKSFLGNLLELRNRRNSVHQDLWNLAIGVAYKIEFLIDQLVLGDTLDSFSRSLQSITEDVMFVKANSLNIFDEGSQDTIKVQQITDKVPSIINNTIVDEVVGFESEKETIIDRLLGGSKKLQVVAVVGMPGSGKTTLATKVYKDYSVTHRFHKMASCSISQVFDRRRVLLELLNQTNSSELRNQLLKQTSDRESKLALDENDLSQQLRKSLKGCKYLIFIDDIWDTKAFDLLKESLPEDSNESRILLTSRNGDVVPSYIPHDKPLLLPLLTEEQSLELLQRKLFPDEKDWPSELHELGMEIVEYCKGLPLTLVLIAGLLKSKEQEGWKDVLKPLRSSIVPDLSARTVELSYTHLPDHLKPLFLWFGAFPEDREISVKEMIWLWISEGLIRKFESKGPEEVARGYINILIARGLVMVARRRSGGGVKTCRIHDLLRDFCLRKANGEFFLHKLKVDDGNDHEEIFPATFGFSSFYELELLSSVELRNMRRLCIYSKPELLKWEVFCPCLRSLLFFGETGAHKLDVSVIIRMFKLLRVLDIGGIEVVGFPREIGALAQIRYLTIQVTDFVGPTIGNLSNLEILILNKGFDTEAIELPDTIWNLRKLRHLRTSKRYHECPIINLPITNLDSSCNLVELESLSILCCGSWSIMKKQLKKFPNIRRLRCLLDVSRGVRNDIDEDDHVSNIKVVDFSFLSQLDSVFFEYSGLDNLEVVFPKNIKKLILEECELPWSKMSSIAKLPHLVVLKLLYKSFDGNTWDFEEEEFPNLKFLMLQSLAIVTWTAASKDQFPKLEKLVLSWCYSLQEIPEDCLGNVETLKAIDVVKCPVHVLSQVRKIEETQKEYGTVLQVHVRDILDDSTDVEISKTVDDSTKEESSETEENSGV